MSQDQRTSEIERASEVRTVDRTPSEPESRFELSLPKIIAGALAAAGAAVASSWLGVAGTVLGAVVGSIIVPVGTALARHPLERSSQVIRDTLPVLPLLSERERRAGSVRHPAGSLSAAHPGRQYVAEPAVPATRSSVERHTGASSQLRRRPIRWGALAVSCLITLVIGFGLLTAAEEIMGRSFSSLIHGGHGGTTLSHVVHHSGSSGTTQPTDPTTSTPSTGDQPTSTAPSTSTEPTTTAPTTSPTSTDPGTTAPPTTEAPTTGSTGDAPASGQATGAGATSPVS
jgi:hypothetical protein